MKRPKPVKQCRGCLKILDGRCIAFTDPAKMWQDGSCWGYTDNLDDIKEIYNGIDSMPRASPQQPAKDELLRIIKKHQGAGEYAG